jgi:hypothetical protein
MTKNMKQIVGAVKRDGRTFWNRIGTAFENRDGSWNIKLDYMPTSFETTLQMRDIDPREDRDGEG